MSGPLMRSACCGEPLILTAFGISAWHAGEGFVCSEFCADGIMPAYVDARQVESAALIKTQ